MKKQNFVFIEGILHTTSMTRKTIYSNQLLIKYDAKRTREQFTLNTIVTVL